MGNSKGYSLAEVLTVIGILALLASIAVPNFIGWRSNVRLKSAAHQIYSSFQAAKIQAARRNALCSVVFDSSDPVGFTVFIDSDFDLVFDAGEEVIQTVNGAEFRGIMLDPTQGGGDGLTFNNPVNAIGFSPNGFILNNMGMPSQGIVYLSNTRKQIAVNVTTGGSLSLFTP